MWEAEGPEVAGLVCDYEGSGVLKVMEAAEKGLQVEVGIDI